MSGIENCHYLRLVGVSGGKKVEALKVYRVAGWEKWRFTWHKKALG